MNMIQSIVLFLALVLISPALIAQTGSEKAKPDAPKTHPFYQQMNFLGGAFHDPKNLECGTGFIGWVQYEGEAPELIFVEDVFRRVKMNCTKQDLQKGNVSCLSKGQITFSHTQRGKTYRATLKLLNKSVEKPLLQLQRFVDDERILLCNYRKVH